MTLFRNRVFTDVFTGLGWMLNPMTGVLIRKGRYRDTDTVGRQLFEDK